MTWKLKQYVWVMALVVTGLLEHWGHIGEMEALTGVAVIAVMLLLDIAAAVEEYTSDTNHK